MRPIIFLTGIVLLLSSIAQQRGFKPVNDKKKEELNSLYQENHALIIGNAAYHKGWPSLPGVEQDVIEVSNTLKKIGFNVIVATDLNKFQMDSAFTSFISTYGVNPESGLLFYFAGHGHTIQTNYGEKLGYIVPVDAVSPNLGDMQFQSNAIEMAQMEIYAKRIVSKHALFIFDACFSGSLFNLTRAVPEVISYKTSQPVRQFISSGSEDEEVSDESIFRKQFVDALISGNADFNNDGYITGTELGRFLQSSVINYSNNTQHPQYGKISNPALNKGDFVFSLNSKINAFSIAVDSLSMDSSANQISKGSIEVATELGGDLYLDGKLLSSISPNSIIPILDLQPGIHYIEIIGAEKWQGSVEILEKNNVFLQIKSRGSGDRNSPFIQMGFVQGGTFQMGSRLGESDELPIHSVTLSDFEISANEITVGQFRKFIKETGYKTEAEVEGWSWFFDDEWKKKTGLTWEINSQGNKAGDYEPVVYVSWNDCQRFMQWMSDKYGGKFRLPTEAEWEYAAKGGIHRSEWSYSGGEDFIDVAWCKSNSDGTAHQVGQQQANALNLYDMSGNVWEWCDDWYNERYYERSTFSNPKGPLIGEYRVIRGGSWINDQASSRVSNRHKYRPKDRDNLTGFRVVREIY